MKKTIAGEIYLRGAVQVPLVVAREGIAPDMRFDDYSWETFDIRLKVDSYIVDYQGENPKIRMAVQGLEVECEVTGWKTGF